MNVLVVLGVLVVLIVLPFLLRKILKRHIPVTGKRFYRKDGVSISLPDEPWERKRIRKNMKRIMYNNPPLEKCVDCPFRLNVLYQYRTLKQHDSLLLLQRCFGDCERKDW